MERNGIKKLNNEEIIKNVQRMKIIIKDKKSARYLRQLTDFEIIKKPITCFSLPTDIDEKVDYSKLKKIAEIEVVHKSSIFGFFTPFFSEIIESIPQDLLKITDSFELNLEVVKNSNSNSYISKIILYKFI